MVHKEEIVVFQVVNYEAGSADNRVKLGIQKVGGGFGNVGLQNAAICVMELTQRNVSIGTQGARRRRFLSG